MANPSKEGAMRPMTLLEPFRALFYTPFYLAEARGGFARQGIDLTLVTAGTTDAAAAKLLAGEADLAWSGPMRPLLLRSRDPACTLRSFCAVVMRDPFLLMGAAPRPGFMLQDLAGLRLGLVSEVPTPAWCLKGDFVRAGIDQRAIHTTTGPSMAENAAALTAGTLDVAQMFEPFACRVEDAGGAVWHAQASRGHTAYTAFYATEAGIAAKREPLQAMIRAMAEALDFIRQAPASEVAERIAPRFADVPADHRLRAIARYQALNLWDAGPHFPQNAFETLGRAMLASGVIAHIPAFADCVDNTLVEEALA
jgi:NitT/TauT family transport system substrate-binding protein